MARKRRRTSLGVLFWIAFILFVLVVFLINRPQIQSVLDNTQLVEIISERFGGEERTVRDEGPPEIEFPEETEEQPDDEPHTAPTDPQADEPSVAEDSPSEEPEAPEPEPDAPETEEPAVDPDIDEPVEEPQPEPQRTRTARLYYVRVTDDGIFAEPVRREIRDTQAPLTETVRALIDGPTADEVADGLLNLIPDGSRLLRASVRDGVAYLDFNEAFRFNPMGVEGYRMQLKQIIYATTEFSTVDRVQFLIEGDQHEWLGGEGVYIGSPLGRDSFS